MADLATELAAGHPGTGAYSEDNVVATAQLNAVNRTTNKASLTASEVYNAIDATEWEPLPADEKAEIWNILHLGTINPFGLEATRFTAIFGNPSATLTALKAARKNNVSRSVELGFGVTKLGYVEKARE